jgi:hypothetical protein
MKRSLTIGLAALFLAGCGGGGSMSVPAGTGAASSQAKSAVRATQTVNKTFNYTLVARNVPPGFDPSCPEVNLQLWGQIGSAYLHPDPFSFPGGEGGATINVSPCNAATGNSMHALLEIQYGHMRFIATGNGNFKLESVDDSGALLTVTDNTTGTSVNTLVYISY